jgi:hypothetical protein
MPRLRSHGDSKRLIAQARLCAAALTPEERKERPLKAAKARWKAQKKRKIERYKRFFRLPQLETSRTPSCPVVMLSTHSYVTWFTRGLLSRGESFNGRRRSPQKRWAGQYHSSARAIIFSKIASPDSARSSCILRVVLFRLPCGRPRPNVFPGWNGLPRVSSITQPRDQRSAVADRKRASVARISASWRPRPYTPVTHPRECTAPRCRNSALFCGSSGTS